MELLPRIRTDAPLLGITKDGDHRAKHFFIGADWNGLMFRITWTPFLATIGERRPILQTRIECCRETEGCPAFRNVKPEQRGPFVGNSDRAAKDDQYHQNANSIKRAHASKLSSTQFVYSRIRHPLPLPLPKTP